MWIEVDLGADRPIGSVPLYPRTDAAGGGSANFPVDFTMRARADGSTTYTTARTVTGQSNPSGAAQTYTLTSTTGRCLRLTTTKLGTPASHESTKFRLQLVKIGIKQEPTQPHGQIAVPACTPVPGRPALAARGRRDLRRLPRCP